MFRHSTVLAPLMLFACLLSLQGFGAERMPADLVVVQQSTRPRGVTRLTARREAPLPRLRADRPQARGSLPTRRSDEPQPSSGAFIRCRSFAACHAPE
jgi:hypothetical protein